MGGGEWGDSLHMSIHEHEWIRTHKAYLNSKLDINTKKRQTINNVRHIIELSLILK